VKIVILAGGLGTRLYPYTKTIPKPMVKIDNIPIIVHIMKIYEKYGFNEFIIASGYKSEVIEKYFQKNNFNFNIKIVFTGIETMTGGRLLKLKKYLNKDTFMMTYGDAISNINIKNLIKFHKKNKKLVTVTGVRPISRFGIIETNKNLVTKFKEKMQMNSGWINGGFFVMEPKFLSYIKNRFTMLERDPMEKITQKKQLACFKHSGFWQCMDTPRDKEKLEDFLKND
tara:strand:+ start:634 stop:1314 length:681 start_codon:yes stop_codon:yes gene_type:complete